MRTIAIVVAAILGSSSAGFAGAADEGFVPLFNGKDLSGWEVKKDKGRAPGEWTVVDGTLTAKPGLDWLCTSKMYGDFVLRLEWRLPENGNSGVYLRVPDIETDLLPTFTGMEIQVLDDEGTLHKGKIKPYQYSGSIYAIVPASKHLNHGAGKWNRFEITCRGDQIKVDFNGETVAEADASKLPELAKRPKRGFIGLQNHGSGVEYRNVSIKVLDRE